jgi:N-acetylglutamate synthase-like GNAT family acetyltransferase
MFITRATRHDKADIEGFYKEHDWEMSTQGKSVGFVARDGLIVGSLQLFEPESNLVIIEDVLVRDGRRGEGIGAQLLNAAMMSRGGTLFLVCHPERRAFYGRSGFTEKPFDELPEPIRDWFVNEEAAPHQLDEGHIHHFMTAR